MAGTCYGDGLTVDGQGRLALDGPVEAEWPPGPTCSIAVNNGIKTDPATGKLWVAPRSIIARDSAVGINRETVPNGTGIDNLTTTTLQMQARQCERMMSVFHVTGGYFAVRQATGNFWILQRYLTIEVNGAPVAFTGMQPIGGAENNSGGIISQSGPVENVTLTTELDPGDLIKLTAHWEMSILTFSANGANGVTWRPPRLEGLLYGYPLA